MLFGAPLFSKFMPAEDGTAADNMPEPPSSANSKIAAWWRARSGLEKILLSIGVVAVGVAGWHFYDQHQDSS